MPASARWWRAAFTGRYPVNVSAFRELLSPAIAGRCWKPPASVVVAIPVAGRGVARM